MVLLMIALAVVLSVVIINSSNPTGMVIKERAVNVSECMPLDERGYYLLNQDIYSPESCIVINSNDVVLDCSGYKILGAGEGFGVSVINKFGITIKNCNIHDFAQKVYSKNSDIYLTNNNFEEAPVVLREETQNGVVGQAFSFAKTGSGITFIILALIAGVIVVFVLATPREPIQNDELDRFLILAMHRKHKPEHIKKTLVEKGWDEKFVNKYYSKFEKKFK